MENTHKKSNLKLLVWMQNNKLLINDFIDVHFQDGELLLHGNYNPKLALQIQDICGEHEYNESTNRMIWTFEDFVTIKLELE